MPRMAAGGRAVRPGHVGHCGPGARRDSSAGVQEVEASSLLAEGQMKPRVRLAMVGCGGIAGAHCKGLEALWNAGYREFEVVAACDVVRDRATAMADEMARWQGARPGVFDNVHALLGSKVQFDAADVCTLHCEHHTVAIPCLDAGKHVTIEKPLAVTLRAGRMMLDAAEKAGRILHVAENYRLSPQHRAIRWAIQSGMVGQVRMIYWLQIRERVWHWGWREHRLQAGAGWTLDGGVHYCDLFRYLIGPVRAVSASVQAFQPFRYENAEARTGHIPVDVEDTSMAILEFESGALGLWVSTSAAPGESLGKNILYGDRGSIAWDTGLKSDRQQMTMEQLVQAHADSLTPAEKERLFPKGITDGIAIELHQFIEALLGRGQVETDGLEGYRAEAIALAVFESDRLGRKVALAEVEGLEVEAYQGEINKALGIC